MLPPTYRPQPDYNRDGPSPELLRKALQMAREGYVPKEKGSVDFQKAAEPLLRQLEDCQHLTAEDLSMRVGC